MDRATFVSRFKDRAIRIAELPLGSARDLAEQANQNEGRGDDTLHTKAEVSALYDLLLAAARPATAAAGQADDDQAAGEPAVAPTHAAADDTSELVLVDRGGQPTEAGQAVALYEKVAVDQPSFFSTPMFLIHIAGWPAGQYTPETPVVAPAGSSLAIWQTEPDNPRHLPPAGDRRCALRHLDVLPHATAATARCGCPSDPGRSTLEPDEQDNDPSWACGA